MSTPRHPEPPAPSTAHSQGECRPLAFEAIRVTSQDAAHPVKNINDVIAVPSVLTGGWETPPFPDYPQDIDIQFYGGECRVRAVCSLVAHRRARFNCNTFTTSPPSPLNPFSFTPNDNDTVPVGADAHARVQAAVASRSVRRALPPLRLFICNILVPPLCLCNILRRYAGRCKEGQPPDVSKAEWKFLGYVSFAPKPGGTARELKVIQVNAVGSFFRFGANITTFSFGIKTTFRFGMSLLAALTPCGPGCDLSALLIIPAT